jgi:hypothetical protein
MRPAVIVLVACTPYAPDLPAEPFFCGSGAVPCPDGYLCIGSGSDAVCAHHAGSGSGSSSCAVPSQGVLATWTFTGQPGTEASVPAGSAAPGISAGMVSRSSAILPAAAADSLDASNWATTAHLDPTRYYTLSIAPPSGCVLDLTAMAVDAAADGVGPTSAEVLTSADGFVFPENVSTAMPSMPALTVTGAAASVELRIFGFFAATGRGTFRLQNTLAVSGALR